MRTRLIRVVGQTVRLSRWWPGSHYHRAEVTVAEVATREEADALVAAASARAPEFAAQLARCAECGAPAPADAQVSASASPRWDTSSGLPNEPGALYFAEWFPCRDASGKCVVHGWTNCDGRHLIAILPNGYAWDIDGRATNCTMPADTEHRCWVRHGDPEKGEPVHVDKSGHTCDAGAGSIAVPGWHGFLHHGELRSC